MEAVVGVSGETIAFRQELVEVLAPIATGGLPPFDGILLLIGATRDQWPATSFPASCAAALQRIRQLPPDVRNTGAARTNLIQVVFEDNWNEIPASIANEVLVLLSSDGIKMLAASTRHRQEHVQRDRERINRFINQRQDRLEAERMRSRMRTGLDGPILHAPVELLEDKPNFTGMRALLDDLLNDENLEGVAALAKQLMAVLNLPKPVSQEDEQPLGGTSDIANRGTLDRLLLSELANDDLTLAVRVALNEALYLRREHPSQNLRLNRLILIDNGIRQWGIPRVIATSVALALAANSSLDTTVDVFQAQGTDLARVDLSCAAGIIKSLESLSFETHVGAALKSFESAAKLPDYELERVIITSPAAAADIDFVQALNASRLIPVYLITVDREGTCQLLEITITGRKTLKSISLDLSAISKTNINSVDLVNRSIGGDLPTIVKTENFPFRFGFGFNPKNFWNTRWGSTFSIVNDGRLLEWSDPELGGKQIAVIKPRVSVLHTFETAENCYAVLKTIGTDSGYRLLRINRHDEVTEVTLTLPNQPIGFCHHDHTLIAIFSDQTSIIDADSGCVGHSLSSLNYEQVFNRFFKLNKDFYALSADSLALTWTRLPFPNEFMRNVTNVFECEGVEGAIAFLSSGELYFIGDEKLISCKINAAGPFVCREVSTNGTQLVVFSVGNGELYVFDLRTQRSERCYWRSLREQIAQRVVRPKNIQYRFRSVTISDDGNLVLNSQPPKKRKLIIENGKLQLVFEKGPISGLTKGFQFEDVANTGGYKYKLFRARFPDGSSLFLDSRGLVHLKSADPFLPEVSLIIANDRVSGWSSRGQFVGDRFFFGVQPNVTAEEFYQTNIEPFINQVLHAC